MKKFLFSTFEFNFFFLTFRLQLLKKKTVAIVGQTILSSHYLIVCYGEIISTYFCHWDLNKNLVKLTFKLEFKYMSILFLDESFSIHQWFITDHNFEKEHTSSCWLWVSYKFYLHTNFHVFFRNLWKLCKIFGDNISLIGKMTLLLYFLQFSDKSMYFSGEYKKEAGSLDCSSYFKILTVNLFSLLKKGWSKRFSAKRSVCEVLQV